MALDNVNKSDRLGGKSINLDSFYPGHSFYLFFKSLKMCILFLNQCIYHLDRNREIAEFNDKLDQINQTYREHFIQKQ